MTSLSTFVFGILSVVMGVFVGAAWGLSRHVELLDWLEARTIRRWMAAMQSLGYEQWRIDQVLEQMGQRIMPPYIPAPEPPKKEDLTQSPESDKVELTDFEKVLAECINRSQGSVLSPEGVAVVWSDNLMAEARKQIAAEIDMKTMVNSYQRNNMAASAYAEGIIDTINKIKEG